MPKRWTGTSLRAINRRNELGSVGEFQSSMQKRTAASDFNKSLRVPHNRKRSPHFVDPCQDTKSDAVAFAISDLSKQILTIEVSTKLQRDQIRFTVPDNFRIEGNCLASALSCLCGRAYQAIHFDFDVSRQALKLIASACQANVTSSGGREPRRPGQGNCLPFSGGMDSLACKHIAPGRDYHLMGIDFGGWFEREYTFLKGYDQITSVCSTDFRRKMYDRNTWLYMAAPMLLVADHFGWGTLAFGSTLEVNQSTLYYRDRNPNNYSLLMAGGLEYENLVHGCSVFLGSRIVLENERDAAKNSLASLAAIGSEKSFRKELALRLVDNLMQGRPTDHFDVAMPFERVVLGQAPYVDFAFLVFAKFCNPNWLSQAVEIPNDVLSAVLETNFDWLFKYHPIGVEKVAGRARVDLLNGLEQNKIELFSESDLQNFHGFTDIIKSLN